MSAQLISIERVIVPDEAADSSYLEQEGFEDRFAAFQNGEFGFVGIRAVALIQVGNSVHRIESPGLWGIEDDSGENYFNEVFDEECAELLDTLRELNVADVSAEVDC